ncbi:MAG: DUF1259 domain-containing protein [Chlamydiae bacterium]|nr:DUF1259 domain-containing protein [Chlamydiota bacterium]MBI3276371.1 DUF1259 domain-containing protein [Chlamydiota bacterium]
MKMVRLSKIILLFLFFGFSGKQEVFSANESQGKLDTQTLFKKIEDLTGAKGKFDEKENVFKVSFPRSDFSIDVAGIKLVPSQGLTVWAAFKIMGSEAMMMGDMVLLEEQVNPVMSVALENGLEVTALHNHFFWDSPKVMFMHIGGTGDAEKIAGAVGKVFAKIKEKPESRPHYTLDSKKPPLDPKIIEDILSAKGEMKDDIYKIVFGRLTIMNGHEMGNAMGVNTWAAFAGNDDQAVVDGDFAMLESEVQGVLKTLRGAGMNIVAIHNHMTMENPRIIFLHFWGMDSTVNLAKGIKKALEIQNIKQGEVEK